VRAIVLGSAAGGGYPQWNCRCDVCRLFWDGDLRVSRRTQSSLAVSSNGKDWVLLNCSPDIREQISAVKALHPAQLRGSPVCAVVLTNGDIDHIGGLLSLREGTAFKLFGTTQVLQTLNDNPIFGVLDGTLVPQHRFAPGDTFSPAPGLTCEAFSVPGKVPLYMEGNAPDTEAEGEYTVGLEVSDGSGKRLHYIPGCSKLTPSLKGRLNGSQCLFFDGTLFDDAEMITARIGHKTGRRMGHMPISGVGGTLASFDGIAIARKYFIHINNSNPILVQGSDEGQAVTNAGWMISADGMEIEL